MRQVTQLTNSITWIARCEHNPDGTHMHLSQYVVEGRDGYLLVDAGEGHGQELTDTIHTITDGAGIDAVVLTHSILPHTENIAAIRDLWDDATIISSVGNPTAVGLTDAEPSFAGQTETLAGETVSFLDPLITDVVVSSWIYHHDSQTMFTAEGVGHYHADGECTWKSSAYEEGIPIDHIHSFASDKLKFLDFVDPSKLDRGFQNLLAEYDIQRLAPAHGTPIIGDDIDRYRETLTTVADSFSYVPVQ